MNQLKCIYNSPFKGSYSHTIHTCFNIISINGEEIETKMTFLVRCPVLSLANGQVSYQYNMVEDGSPDVGSVASFTCNSGYSLHGDSSRTCQTSGSWSQQTPTCTGIGVFP